MTDVNRRKMQRFAYQSAGLGGTKASELVSRSAHFEVGFPPPRVASPLVIGRADARASRISRTYSNARLTARVGELVR